MNTQNPKDRSPKKNRNSKPQREPAEQFGVRFSDLFRASVLGHRIFNWLPDMDLNHDKQIQSLLCYRYTIGQTSVPKVRRWSRESRSLSHCSSRRKETAIIATCSSLSLISNVINPRHGSDSPSRLLRGEGRGEGAISGSLDQYPISRWFRPPINASSPPGEEREACRPSSVITCLSALGAHSRLTSTATRMR